MASYPQSQIPIAPASERLRLKTNQSNQTSQYTGVQSVITNYSQWLLEINWPRMSTRKAEILAAWLDNLAGAAGTFEYSPVTGVYSNDADLVTTGITYPTARTAEVGGWTANAATNLVVGQIIQIGAQLLRIAAVPLKADANGHAVIEFNPQIRKQIAANSAVITDTPKGIFRLSDNDGSGYQIDPDWTPEFAATVAVEYLS